MITILFTSIELTLNIFNLVIFSENLRTSNYLEMIFCSRLNNKFVLSFSLASFCKKKKKLFLAFSSKCSISNVSIEVPK